MKKIIFSIVSVFCFCGFVKAGDDSNRVWRSSLTTTGEYNAVIATGVVKMFIMIQNAGSADAELEVFSGGSDTGTATRRDYIDTSNNNVPLSPYAVTYSTPRYNNKGTTPAAVKFIWDWNIGVPRGQEDRGY